MNRYKIGFIGAGKIGTTLGSYFVSNGTNINGYFSRTKSSADNASALTHSCTYNTIKELVDKCNLIFITTPDSEIEKVWAEISQYDISNKIIIHTSGSLTSEAFSNIKELNAFGYSLHPMYAFSNKDGSFDKLEKVCFTLEGNAEKLSNVEDLIEQMGNTVLLIDTENKPLYHLANVMASNFVLALIYESLLYLQKCNITGDEALAALMPLIKANINNIEKSGIKDALTGPIDRNDILTVKKHLQVIPEGNKGLYRDLSLILTEIAQYKNTQKNYGPLKNILSETDIKLKYNQNY